MFQNSPRLDSDAIESVATAVSELLEFDRFAITRRDPETNSLVLGPSVGAHTYAPGHQTVLDSGVFERIFGERNVHVFDEYGLDEIIETPQGAKSLQDLGFRTTIIGAVECCDAIKDHAGLEAKKIRRLGLLFEAKRWS